MNTPQAIADRGRSATPAKASDSETPNVLRQSPQVKPIEPMSAQALLDGIHARRRRGLCATETLGWVAGILKNLAAVDASGGAR